VRIAVIGGGPAGLYFSLLAKKADPSHDITVFERNAPDATFGWGVVFSEETLGSLREADRATYDAITESWARWSAIDVKYRGETIRSRGHVFSGIARKRLLQILQERGRDLGVDLRFGAEVSELPQADLIVGADGVNSLVRKGREAAFGTEQHVHGTRFAWFGTDLAFKAFTFIFRENEHGLFQVHAYPFDAHTSTFIVECPEEVWRRAGLDRAGEEESIRYCEKLFADDLAGHRLLSNKSIWISFVTLRNQTWHDGKVVMLGDAAHTAHFTIGSGTKLAMEDAVSLAEWVGRWPGDIERALTFYEMDRQPVVERFQEAALESARYFENVPRYAKLEPIQFAFNLLTRSGRITHLELERRDPPFIARVDAWFAGGPEGSVAPPPHLVPLTLRGLSLSNRVVRWPKGLDDSVEGVPSDALAERLLEAARSGAGLVLTEMVAVSRAGRITIGTPGLWTGEQAEAWRRIVTRIRAETGAAVCILLGHAGARGATRPRSQGADRPIGDENWEVVAPSPVPYAPMSRTPVELDRAGMRAIVTDFERAAGLALASGLDMIEIHMGHGYLLGSFLSPLTNRRTDEYGSNRLAFPLEVASVIGTVWPEERPLAAAVPGTDWASGGLEGTAAVEAARALREGRFDLIHVLAGQTVLFDRPNYGRQYLVPFSDRIRNEADVPTLVGGNITSNDEMSTILAAARSDLTVIDAGEQR
jgi:anthraniloyl-CoA monooxygenase